VGYFSDTYANDLRLPLLDWLSQSTKGQNVADLVLSLANRAQRNLWAKKPWSDLATDVSVVVDSTASYVFPADFGRIIQIWGNLDGTGVPSYWYYEGFNLESGYKLRDLWTKATGHSWKITFNYAQPTSVAMVYQRLLEDFVGTGTEYLFFPANLLLLECQKIKTREKGLGDEWKMANAAFEDEYKDFCNAHQWVNQDSRARINDANGAQVFMENYSCDGSMSGVGSPLPNSYLR